MGILTGVELDLSSTLNTTLQVTNGASSSSNGNVKTEMTVTVLDPHSYITGIPQIDILSSAFSYTLAPGDGTTSGLLTKTGTSSNLYTVSSLLAEFSGPGNISLAASTFTQTLLANNGGNTGASQVTNAGLTGTVTYFYTAVPLPSALLLLGPGLLGLVGIRRRFRA